MKKINFCIILSFLSVMAMAQAKKNFTLDDLLPGGRTYSQLTPQNMYTAWWGDRCVETSIDKCEWIDTKNGTKKTLFTIEELNQWLGGDEDNKPVRSCYNLQFPHPTNTWVAVKLTNDKAETNRKHKYVVLDFTSGKMIWQQEYPAEASLLDRSEVSKNVAYIYQQNLYVTDANNKMMAVSTDGSNDLVYGQTVHRDEFGIHKGTYWSPDGKLLAYYRMDQSMVPDYPQVDIRTRMASTYSCKYPMAGEASHQVTVGVFNPTTETTTWLQAGDPTDRYFTNISWSPDSKKLFMIELNRDQNHAVLVQYNALTGEKEGVLYEEKHPKYVEPMHGLLFLPWDDTKFIYQTQRDGYNQLYLFDLSVRQNGEEVPTQTGGTKKEYVKVTPLTSGAWVVKDVLGFNQKEKSILICTNEIHPLQSNIFKVRVKDGKRTLLDNGEGVHYGRLSQSGAYLVDLYSSPTVTKNIDLTNVKTCKSCRLLTAEDPWKEYNVPEITSGSIKAADGQTDLYYRMVKPVDFDPNKKYPTVVYVYGGPHAHNVEASRNYLARGWEIYMAQKGYLLFILDNRGSQHRGIEFENVTFRQLGVEEMKDQMEGVKYLKSLPYVDADRLGVHGWSYGGFMTTNLMLTYPDVFKVGVAGGPVIDWQYYEVMYGERYMDSPQNNPEGYKGSNLRLKAGNLKGKLQVIIGYNDPVCVPQHALSFLRACIDAGTHPDFFMYPNQEHNMLGTDRVHLHERITQYFEDYLK